MKYGFIIDNRKCIGCHACTTACKSENEVPIGVNRTWVKQIEKGSFPEVRRHFSVMRCNHCTDAPCVSICPTQALFKREDGIVDFDADRCIGCKSCMQACPYDALYIDPDTNTAAKCNYCAHRIDVGLEPACVNVCPEEAIISGDMEDPDSKIFHLLNRHAVKSRKPEKGTEPNVFYIDADDASLVPGQTEKSADTLWGEQVRGVGHFAKEAEKMAFSNPEIAQEYQRQLTPSAKAPRTVEVLMNPAKRVYDTPDKGLLWGWEVSAYVWTKALAAGIFLMMFAAWLWNPSILDASMLWTGIGASMLFLSLTGALLIKDLDRPDRFLYVLLRPQWNSWLVKGGYAITVYGFCLLATGVANYANWPGLQTGLMYVTAAMALIVAVYTAFLFAQAKGRDFWQSPSLPFHMINHAVMAGAAAMLMGSFLGMGFEEVVPFWQNILWISIGVNLLILGFELLVPHPTLDAKKTVQNITHGRYKNRFWMGVVLLGNVVPGILTVLWGGNVWLGLIIGAMVLLGIFFTEQIWVKAPQEIPLG